MFSRELSRVRRKLRRMVRSGRLKDKAIYLFGASANTRQIADILRDLDVEPHYILDNDPKKQGGYCSRIQVVPVSDIAVNGRDCVVLIYSFFWREMSLQLKKFGVPARNIIPLVRKGILLDQLMGAAAGRSVYQKLKKKYGDIPVFLCPYTGTGDIYLIGTFWKQYLAAHNITDYIFCVISGACKKVTQLFAIRNVEQLKEKESAFLIKYYMLNPDKLTLKVLNDGWGPIRSNPLEWFRGYKGLGFTEMFRKFVFDLPDTAKPEPPVLPDADAEIRKIFEKYRLQEGRTVILSPTSNTLADLPDEFWDALAGRLLEAGYSVCTNCKGDKKDPPAQGTVPVFFPLNIAPQFVSKAGCFIGIRSGLCDIVSASDAKKIILYDSRDYFYNCSAFAYFSLKQMGLCEDAVEIVFDQDISGLVETILHEIWRK